MDPKIELSKTGALKLLRGECDLFFNDLQDPPRGVIPGQWCSFVDTAKKTEYIGFMNLRVSEKTPIGRVVYGARGKTPWEIVEEKIIKAVHYRLLFSDLSEGCRLIYGERDELPGLIVDSYQNCNIIQINTAGIDQFRTQIKNLLNAQTNRESFLLDNKAYRQNEELPEYNEPLLTAPIEILENNLRTTITPEAFQKLGHYYDHRHNRLRFKELLSRFAGAKEKGLDLFSYSGMWGMMALRGGLQNCTFVDQGDLEVTVTKNLEVNGLQNRGDFIRGDVFLELDKLYDQGLRYDVIISDPPAFAKSQAVKTRAIDGYKKLHEKVIKLANPGAVIAICSCTKYVSYEELDQTVQEAANRRGKKIRLLDQGAQGRDHPITGFGDRSHYIKYLAYYIA